MFSEAKVGRAGLYGAALRPLDLNLSLDHSASAAPRWHAPTHSLAALAAQREGDATRLCRRAVSNDGNDTSSRGDRADMSVPLRERAQSATRGRAVVDMRQQLDQRRIPVYNKRPKSSPANARGTTADNSLLAIDGSSIELGKKDHHHVTWQPSSSIADLALASSYLASSSFYTQLGAEQEECEPFGRPNSPHADEKPSRLAELCDAVEHGDVPDDLTMSEASVHNGEEAAGGLNAAEREPLANVDTVQQSEPSPSKLMPSGDRFFLDLWLQRHGSTALDADPLNISLLCQLQADEAAARRQLLADQESDLPAHLCSSRYHFQVGLSALKKLDVLVDALGERYPLLADLRSAFLPLIGPTDRIAALSESTTYMFQHNSQAAQCTQLSLQLLEAQTSCQGLQGVLAVERQKAKQVEGRLAAVNSARETLQKTLNATQSELRDCKTELKVNIEKLKDETQKRSALLQQISKADREKFSLDLVAKELKAEVHSLDKQTKEAAAALETCRKQLTEAKRDRSEAKKELASIGEAHKKQLLDTNIEKRRLQDQVMRTVIMMAQCGVDNHLEPPADISFDVPALSTQRLEDHALANYIQSFTTFIHGTVADLQATNAGLMQDKAALIDASARMVAEHEEKVTGMQTLHKNEVAALQKSNTEITTTLRFQLKVKVEQYSREKATTASLTAQHERNVEHWNSIKAKLEARLQNWTDECCLAWERIEILELDHEAVAARLCSRLVQMRQNADSQLRGARRDLDDTKKKHQAELEAYGDKLAGQKAKYSSLEAVHEEVKAQLAATTERWMNSQQYLAACKEGLLMAQEEAESALFEHTVEMWEYMEAQRKDLADAETQDEHSFVEMGTSPWESRPSSGVRPLSAARPSSPARPSSSRSRPQSSRLSRAASRLSRSESGGIEVLGPGMSLDADDDSVPLDGDLGADQQPSVIIEEDSVVTGSHAEEDAFAANNVLDADDRQVIERLASLSTDKLRSQKRTKARRRDTFFDGEDYAPVEVTVAHNDEAWQALAERLHLEKNKISQIRQQYHSTKFKVKEELERFNSMFDVLKVELPKRLTEMVQNVSTILLSHLTAGELGLRTSALVAASVPATPVPAPNPYLPAGYVDTKSTAPTASSMPSSFVASPGSSIAFEADLPMPNLLDGGSFSSTESLPPAMGMDGLFLPGCAALKDVDTRTLMKLTRALTRRISTIHPNAALDERDELEGVIEDTDSDAEDPAEVDDWAQGSQELREGSVSSSSHKRTRVKIEYSITKSDATRTRLRDYTKRRLYSTGTQTGEDEVHVSLLASRDGVGLRDSGPKLRGSQEFTLPVPQQLPQSLSPSFQSHSSSDIALEEATLTQELSGGDSSVCVAKLRQARLYSDMLADVQSASELLTPQKLSLPFIGYIRQHEKVLAREIGLMKVALRECKVFYEKLNFSLQTLLTSQPAMRAALGEVSSTVFSHAWLFDPVVFTRKVVSKTAFEDPVDVFAQCRVLDAYRESLKKELERLADHYDGRDAGEAFSAPQTAIVVRALDDLIKDLQARIAKKGGTRAMMYSLHGALDSDVDLSSFDPATQLSALSEMVRYMKLSYTRVQDTLMLDIEKLQSQLAEATFDKKELAQKLQDATDALARAAAGETRRSFESPPPRRGLSRQASRVFDLSGGGGVGGAATPSLSQALATAVATVAGSAGPTGTGTAPVLQPSSLTLVAGGGQPSLREFREPKALRETSCNTDISIMESQVLVIPAIEVQQREDIAAQACTLIEALRREVELGNLKLRSARQVRKRLVADLQAGGVAEHEARHEAEQGPMLVGEQALDEPGAPSDGDEMMLGAHVLEDFSQVSQGIIEDYLTPAQSVDELDPAVPLPEGAAISAVEHGHNYAQPPLDNHGGPLTALWQRTNPGVAAMMTVSKKGPKLRLRAEEGVSHSAFFLHNISSGKQSAAVVPANVNPVTKTKMLAVSASVSALPLPVLGGTVAAVVAGDAPPPLSASASGTVKQVPKRRPQTASTPSISAAASSKRASSEELEFVGMVAQPSFVRSVHVSPSTGSKRHDAIGSKAPPSGLRKVEGLRRQAQAATAHVLAKGGLSALQPLPSIDLLPSDSVAGGLAFNDSYLSEPSQAPAAAHRIRLHPQGNLHMITDSPAASVVHSPRGSAFDRLRWLLLDQPHGVPPLPLALAPVSGLATKRPESPPALHTHRIPSPRDVEKGLGGVYEALYARIYAADHAAQRNEVLAYALHVRDKLRKHDDARRQMAEVLDKFQHTHGISLR